MHNQKGNGHNTVKHVQQKSRTPLDIRGSSCVTIDLTGKGKLVTEHDPLDHKFEIAIDSVAGVSLPVAEILMFVGTKQVSIVGKLTKRTDVLELSMDIIEAAGKDDKYRAEILEWIEAGGLV